MTFKVLFASLLFLGIASTANAAVIKGQSYSTLYYTDQGKRYVFPNDRTYFSWYADFSNVITVQDTELYSLPLAGNVTYRPGKKLVKVTTDPKTYAVDANGTLRWVMTEEIARALYGSDWNKQVDDVPDEFFVNYKVGSPIASANDFVVSEVMAKAETVSNDKAVGGGVDVLQNKPVSLPTNPAPQVIEPLIAVEQIKNPLNLKITAKTVTQIGNGINNPNSSLILPGEKHNLPIVSLSEPEKPNSFGFVSVKLDRLDNVTCQKQNDWSGSFIPNPGIDQLAVTGDRILLNRFLTFKENTNSDIMTLNIAVSCTDGTVKEDAYALFYVVQPVLTEYLAR